MSVEEREGLEEQKERATAKLEAVNLKLAALHAKLEQQKPLFYISTKPFKVSSASTRP